MVYAYHRVVLWLVGGLIGAQVSGLFFGLFSGLFFGLGAVLQHYALRFWLARDGLFPWKTISFLEDATNRILLRHVGGGYSFTHRLLLDFFADAYAGVSSASPNTTSEQTKVKNDNRIDNIPQNR